MTPPEMDPRLLMVQGTTSDAGKSAFITALCRLLARQGYRVAPYKSQNMALNSAVSVEGGEIGRAQAVQAEACGLPPSIRFNPILLKPTGERCSQVIVNGRSIGHMSAREYHALKPQLRQQVVNGVKQLADEMQFVMIEGAGSPAEINLRQHDLVNMGLALPTRAPVIIIADIDRGGVFAHLVGTLALLSDEERQQVIGLVINRFRGDPALLQPGVEWLEHRTGLPVLAVVPWIDRLYLDAEDSVSNPSSSEVPSTTEADLIRVTVIQLPSISNQTDIDALRLHPHVSLTLAHTPEDAGPSDICILPGSKRTLNDLAWLRQQGWAEWLTRHLRYGGKVVGICGGYQMLGTWLEDPHGYDTPRNSPSPPAARTAGLGWLGHTTRYTRHKVLRQSVCTGSFDGAPLTLSGYEIHMGVSTPPDPQRGEQPFAYYNDDARTPEGCRSADGQIIGTYLHGLFDTPEALESVLRWAAPQTSPRLRDPFDMKHYRLQEMDRLADGVAGAIRLARWPEGPLKEALHNAISASTHPCNGEEITH